MISLLTLSNFNLIFQRYTILKKKNKQKKHGPVNITHLLFLHGVMKQSHFCCMSLASISYISKQKGVGDARHIPCQVFSLQSGGSTCFNPTENPAHIAGLLWLLFWFILLLQTKYCSKEEEESVDNILHCSQIRVEREKLRSSGRT